IQHDGVERLGGARAAADILRAVPEAQVVLIRTRGMWGSRFSFAFTGTRPPLIRTLWQAVGLLLSNLLVFMPRRSVDITVERVDQLGLDSLDRMEMTLAVEQQFGFHGDQVPATVGDLWALAQGLVKRAPPKPPPPAWFRQPADEGPLVIMGESIPEAFVARALAHRKDIACADDLSGMLTYEQALVGALTLSRRFASLPGRNIGILLPASVACDVAFLALHLAGKLPVLLNWTTGPANLAHAARLMELTEVVSSRAFLDRLGMSV